MSGLKKTRNVLNRLMNMSDDEEVIYIKKQKTIHYGSLEDQERNRLATLAAAENDGDNKVVGGNINVSNGN